VLNGRLGSKGLTHQLQAFDKTYFNRKRWEIKEHNGELGGNFVMLNGWLL